MSFLRSGLLTLLLLACVPAAHAETISFGGGTIEVDDDNGALTEHSVGAHDHVFEAEYYFRTASMTQEDGLAGTNADAFVTSVTQTAPDTITVFGSAAEFDYELDYVLLGPSLSTSLLITNTSASPLTISIFAYQDLDVDPTFIDYISWDGTTLAQTGSTAPFKALAFTPGTAPDAVVASTFAYLTGELRDGSVTNLVDGTGLPFGPDDGTFAMQYDLVIPGSGSTTLNTLTVVPEPTPAVLMAAGLLGLGIAGRRLD